MAIIKKTNKFYWGCEEKGTLIHCWWECKLVQPPGKSLWRVLKKLKIELPDDPEIPLLGIYLKGDKPAHSTIHSVHSSTVYNSQTMQSA
jgi:hypothetical protein